MDQCSQSNMFVSDLLIHVVICCALHGMSLNGVSSAPNTQSLPHEVSASSSSPESTGDLRIESSPQSSKPLLLPSPSPSSSLSSPLVSLSPTSTTPVVQTLTPLPSAVTSSEEIDSTTKHSRMSVIDRYFYWDKEALSAKDYQQNVCSYRCDGDKKVDVMKGRNKCRDIECIECECDRPSCEVYHTCCPNITEPQVKIDVMSFLYMLEQHSSSQDYTWTVGQNEIFGTSTSVTLDAGNTSSPLTAQPLDITDSESLIVPNGDDFSGWDKGNRGPNLFCDSYSNPDFDPYLYIRSCPRDFMLDSVRFLCEIDPRPHQVTTSTHVRVTDRATNATYYNRYCAECNGVTEMVPWLLNIDCHHNMYIYPATNLQELLRLSMRNRSFCRVTQDIPHDIKIVKCNIYHYRKKKFIDKCNVTGWWTIYDQDVQNACEGHQFSSVKYRVIDMDVKKKNLYKNIFCYICNNERYPVGTTRCNTSIVNSGSVPLPFSLLLGFRELRTLEEDRAYVSPFTFNANCTDLEWPSPNGDCLTLQCSPGKLPNGTTCFTALPTIVGLGYNLQLWYIPGGNVTLGSNNSNLAGALFKFMKKGLRAVDGVTEYYELDFRQIMKVTPGKPSGDIPSPSTPCSLPDSCSPNYWVAGSIVASRNFSRDEFENDFLLDLFNRRINFEIANGREVTMNPSVMMTALSLPYDYRFTEEHQTIVTGAGRAYKRELSDRDLILKVMNLFLNVTNLLSCSYVSFDESKYTVTWYDKSIPPTASITLDLQVTNVAFSELDDFNQLNIDSDGTLQICIDLLNQKVLEIEKQNKLAFYRRVKFESQVDESTFAQYVLTLICMSASMLCLAVTLLTYFRFSVLRSVAGKNNMFLCASLFLAQAFLLTASHVNGPSLPCTVLGILTHFMWLGMFCWSLICCFHMFRVFTAKTRNSHSTARSERLQLLKRVMTSVLTPALVIVTVVVTSYLSSETAEIGYGDRACYLDSNLLVGVSMILPLAVVIVCNTTFFIVTVVKIHNVRKLQSHDFLDDRQYLYVYIKLSTITGSFWTIFIIAEASDNDQLRFIAIVLNGLQGVFIFVSYICNLRVWNLYRHSFGLKPLSPTSSSEQQKRGICSILSKLASAVRPGKHKNSTDRESEHSTNANVGKKAIDINDLDLKIENEESIAGKNKP